VYEDDHVADWRRPFCRIFLSLVQNHDLFFSLKKGTVFPLIRRRLQIAKHAKMGAAQKNCNACVNSKRRCDRKKPACGRCARLGHLCGYGDTGRTPRPAAGTVQLAPRIVPAGSGGGHGGGGGGGGGSDGGDVPPPDTDGRSTEAPTHSSSFDGPVSLVPDEDFAMFDTSARFEPALEPNFTFAVDQAFPINPVIGPLPHIMLERDLFDTLLPEFSHNGTNTGLSGSKVVLYHQQYSKLADICVRCPNLFLFCLCLQLMVRIVGQL
jgi:hypothetical protein